MAEHDAAPPAAMPANVDGSISPHTHYINPDLPSNIDAEPMPSTSQDASVRSASSGNAVPAADRMDEKLPARAGPRSVSSPMHSLNSARSNPVLLPSRQAGSVKNIATKFDQHNAAAGGRQPQLTVRTGQEKGRYTAGGRTRSPVSSSGSSQGMTKLQKRRPGQPKSPQKSPREAGASFASHASRPNPRSQPHAAFSPKARASARQGGYMSAKPLFGELTADGDWHGNFDLAGYGRLPSFQPAPRRQSDGGVALGHGRSQSHHDIAGKALSPHGTHRLHHKRSRSEMDAWQPQPAPSMPVLNTQKIPSLLPTPPSSGTRQDTRKDSPTTSRIPVSSRGQSDDHASDPQSRSASAMSNRGRGHRVPKSPPAAQKAMGKENATPSSIPRSRYHPPPLSTTQSGPMLSAKIVPQMPKSSPPLRSSRPRQPVSAATTAASRARAAERNQSPSPAQGRLRPSEQWLGKPYDAQRERSRRKIPELGKVDFAERRARIQRAISQNLEEKKSEDALRTRSRSRQPADSRRRESASEAGTGRQNSVDEHQTAELDAETGQIEQRKEAAETSRPRGLSLDTKHLAAPNEPEPLTAATEFEVDESPVLGNQSVEQQPPNPEAVTDENDLSGSHQPGTQQRHIPPPIESVPEAPGEKVQSPSVLDNIMRMRQRRQSSPSHDGTEFAEDSPSAEDSRSDAESKWGPAAGDEGSIKIMLEEDSGGVHQAEPWSSKQLEPDFNHVQAQTATEDPRSLECDRDSMNSNGQVDTPIDRSDDGHFQDDASEPPLQDPRAFTSDEYTASPINDHDNLAEDIQDTPRKSQQSRDNTLQPAVVEPLPSAPQSDGHSLNSDDAIAQALDRYQSTGSITPEMLQYIQSHNVDFQRISANQGSDAIMVQNLLDSMLDARREHDSKPSESMADSAHQQEEELLHSKQYEMPSVTPETPSDAEMETGTAVIWGTDQSFGSTTEDDDDFAAKISKADEEWEKQQRREAVLGADEFDTGPTPPPKDTGYTPRSSTGPNSATFPPPNLNEGLRISTSQIDILPEVYAAGESAKNTPVNDRSSNSTPAAPPQPNHAPPPPPPASQFKPGIPEVPPIPAPYSEHGPKEISPVMPKAVWTTSGSSRPSVDSQRVQGSASLPGGTSMSSFAPSTRNSSADADSQARPSKASSPGPDQKRLMKRKHVIRELLDTEQTYYQDLKIVEDIYKATLAELVSVEDKKTLFGNCDEIERFSIHFFDDLRKSVESIYKPPKQMRWAGKRSSFSTMHSEATGRTSFSNQDHNNPDDEKDRATTIGKCFNDNIERMNEVYGFYLRNHDAANQRLAVLKNTPSVKCWLDECHNNASDITSAWDLDSLLVKPTQRVSRYPMLLQQLLDTTPADHPDHEQLKRAYKRCISMLTDINESKKREDIVDHHVNRKKDIDVRSGIAKAFGRRTEKLKERVGIAEAFQDTEFDELSHKYGGHFIRLQICMRDVQDYVNRIDKTMEQITNCAAALDMFTDVATGSLPEVEAKWRRYGQSIREIGSIAFPEHKAAVQRRVIQPMIACIKLHDGPQNAINKRKKRIVDYAKCRTMEKRGEKPDKRTAESSDIYVALNDQLKIELPKLYNLTAQLVQGCLNCFLEIQLGWFSMWERKLRPILEVTDIPSSIQEIEPAFRPDYELIKSRLTELAICNGACLADSANFLSPTTTLVDKSEESSLKRPSTLEGSKRTLSAGSDTYQMFGITKRYSNGYASGSEMPLPADHRVRSNSSLSTRGAPTLQTPASGMSANRPWASTTGTPTSSFSTSRPATANASSGQPMMYQTPRQSSDNFRSPRSSSGQTYLSAWPGTSSSFSDNRTNHGIFNSALPPDALPSSAEQTRPVTPGEQVSPGTPNQKPPAIFVCASLFEFSIDKTRKEAGFPYLTYVQGEVFDVVAQKGELWLARNQDDSTGALGWIWEQHFVILSQD
ncbi:hypothetical protein KC333_g4313 [Hortaea werneckii]|nr:hypothetical protein KC333_g4313 [Hortaea werneckii]